MTNENLCHFLLVNQVHVVFSGNGKQAWCFESEL